MFRLWAYGGYASFQQNDLYKLLSSTYHKRKAVLDIKPIFTYR